MIKYYAKQVSPECTEDNLFFQYKKGDKFITEMNDDFLAENVIIGGNRDFISLSPANLENLQKNIEYFNSDLQGYCGVHGDLTELANYYFKKHNGKHWSKKELSLWRKVSDLTENYSKDNEEEAFKLALKLITGKEWNKTCIRGCSQGDYQYMWYSEEISQKDRSYIEMCYFNTGTEYIVYENEEDFENEDNGCSYYVDSWRSEDNLCEALGCNREEINIYEFTGYKHIAQYKLA